MVAIGYRIRDDYTITGAGTDGYTNESTHSAKNLCHCCGQPLSTITHIPTVTEIRLPLKHLIEKLPPNMVKTHHWKKNNKPKY